MMLTGAIPAAYVNHFSCWRSSPPERRNRMIREITAAITRTNCSRMEAVDSVPMSPLALWMPSGLWMGDDEADERKPNPTKPVAACTPASQSTHRQRGEGSRPVGKRRSSNAGSPAVAA
jgi:hypothetical protein